MTASGHVEPKPGQAIRRKPVIQSGPAEKIPSRSPTTASGRKLMAANGCFGDAEPKGSRAAHLNGRFAACFVGDVVISAVTLAELEFGIACSSLAVQATNQSRRAAR